MGGQSENKGAPVSPLREIVQPFIDLVKAPRALWGVNLAYFLEGLVYFGMLGYLAMHFSDFVFKGVEHADEWSHSQVMILTAGITISMFFLGFVADKWGVRRALVLAFILLLSGRIVMSSAPTLMGLMPEGPWSPLHLVTVAGMVLVVIGYGMYQPAAYAAVRQFTTPKTAGMSFAMLYALMNLGGWVPTFAFLLRDDDYLGLGIPGTWWVYTALTVVALLVTLVLLSRRTVENAIREAKEQTARLRAEEGQGKEESAPSMGKGTLVVEQATRIPLHLWLVPLAVIGMALWRIPMPWAWYVVAPIAAAPLIIALLPSQARKSTVSWIANHPLGDAKFAFFIFALIPVQTLFTYNWLVLPQYINRAFEGWIGEYFEIASNANPILIFVLVPIIAAATQKAKVYNMMVLGTLVMSSSAFFLAAGPHPWALITYIIIMTIGEAMWQPRFLQYAAEIAPEGRTGTYMGVAQLPWFLTKLLVPLLYSGFVMDRYCPAEGPKNTEMMWLIFGGIAVLSPLLLIAAKGWVGKDFKTHA